MTGRSRIRFTAPASLYWQLQWDDTNSFYSGSWYDLASTPGWSAMSGNYGNMILLGSEMWGNVNIDTTPRITSARATVPRIAMRMKP